MQTADQIVDDFVRKVREQQEILARTLGPLLPEVHRRVAAGISVWRGRIAYLLVTPNDVLQTRPVWYPSELFTVVDSHLPSDWKYMALVQDRDSLLQALWGYSELIDLEGEYEKLLEGDTETMGRFWSRKAEMDGWWRGH